MGSEQHSPTTQEKVCNICGDEGYPKALICCSDCADTFVHLYCVGITPSNINDTYEWVCEYCLTSSNSESPPSWNFNDASVRGTSKSCGDYSGSLEIESSNEIVAVGDLPKPLCILLPCNSCSHQADIANQSELTEKIPRTASYVGLSVKKWEEQEAPASSFMERPESVVSGVALVVSSSGEIIMHRSMNSSYYMHPQITEDHLSPISSFMVSDGMREPELLVSSFMERPKSIMDGLVLLASASGLIVVDKVMSYNDCPHCLRFASSDLNSFHEASSDKVISGLSCNYIAEETVDKYGETAHGCDNGEPMVLNESYQETDGTHCTCQPSECGVMSEVEGFTACVLDASIKNIDGIQVNESRETDGMEVEGEANVASYNSVRSSILNWKRKRKRSARLSRHPERNEYEDVTRDEAIAVSNNSVGSSIPNRKRSARSSHQRERNEYKDVVRDESDISDECLAQRRKRRESKKWLDCPEHVDDEAKDMRNKPIDDLRIEIPFETALSAEAEKESIMKQILEIFRGAGWTIRRGPAKKSSKSQVRVFYNPAGRIFRSVAKACNALQCEVLDRVGSFRDKGKVENYFTVKVSLETALSVGDMKSIRKQVERMLRGAGWKVERRHPERVYVSPEGDAHSSFTKAYGVLQQEVIQGKGKVKAGEAYLNSIKHLVADMLLHGGWTVEQRRCKGSSSSKTVYVNPQGKCHWKITGAYRAIQQNGAGGEGKGEVL